jgi:ankyrin repeat protein
MNRLLINATINNDLNDIRQLIAGGANVNLANHNGLTPLMNAVGLNRCSIEIVNTLISAGANVNLQDNEGNTALIYALYGTFRSLEEDEENIDDEDEMDIDTLREFYTEKKIITIKKLEEVLKILLENGADVNIENNNGKTPLDIAIKGGIQEIIDILTKPENEAKKYIAIKAYVQSQRINSSSTESVSPISGFYHSKIDEPDYIMEKVFNMAYGEDEKEGGAEESKRSDSGGRRKKSRKKSKSKRRKSVRRKKSVAKKKKSRRESSKRRKSVRK